MGVMAAGSAGLRRGSVTAGDGFVVGVGLASAWTRTSVDAPDSQVIHGSRTCGRDVFGQRWCERTHECVDNALRSFDIAPGNCCRRTRVDDRTLRCEDLDGAH